MAGAKAGQVKGDNMGVLITAAVVFVFLPLIITAVIFVSIVWTHRPDLSVMDILRESVREIKNDMRAGKDRQKGKAYEQNYHLWNTLGVLYFNQSDYESASEAFEQAITINPYYYDALFNLRDAYGELGNTVGAAICAQRMREIPSSNHV